MARACMRTLDAIRQSHLLGFTPTVRDLCRLTGYRSTSTVSCHLRQLEREGHILPILGKNRSILLTGPVENRCSSCRHHATPDIGEQYGVCRRISTEGPVGEKARAWAFSVLFAHPDFGCVLWEGNCD